MIRPRVTRHFDRKACCPEQKNKNKNKNKNKKPDTADLFPRHRKKSDSDRRWTEQWNYRKNTRSCPAKKNYSGRQWWHMPLIPALGKQRQVDLCEFKASKTT